MGKDNRVVNIQCGIFINDNWSSRIEKQNASHLIIYVLLTTIRWTRNEFFFFLFFLKKQFILSSKKKSQYGFWFSFSRSFSSSLLLRYLRTSQVIIYVVMKCIYPMCIKSSFHQLKIWNKFKSIIQYQRDITSLNSV